MLFQLKDIDGTDAGIIQITSNNRSTSILDRICSLHIEWLAVSNDDLTDVDAFVEYVNGHYAREVVERLFPHELWP